MDFGKESLALHRENRGKWEVRNKIPLLTHADLALAYTPGVAAVSTEIAEKPEQVWDLTPRGNSVAVVSNGTAVLGLGDIGPGGALPVMEGKSILFKQFAGIDAVPIVTDLRDPQDIIRFIRALAPSFGGINLEDIKAPECFQIEQSLQDLGIPVFHDDQHGTAIVVLSGLINALKITGKKLEECRAVVNGAGSAGIAIAKLMLSYGFKHITMCDSQGIVSSKSERLNSAKREMLKVTNLEDKSGTLADAMVGTDIFIGVSGPGCVTQDMVRSMNEDPIVLAMANPVPEIMPDEAIAAGARIVGTGRSDFPNQINNVVAFPGIFRGALEARAERITNDMKLAAAVALAELVDDDKLCEEFIMPEPFDPRVKIAVAKAVRDCWEASQAAK